MKSKPLLEAAFKLQRFNAKGGWTYISIPPLQPVKGKAFGMPRVKGSIDDHTFEQYHLMALKDGNLFLSVNANIRKAIGKQAGDMVKLVLYEDNSPLKIPADLVVCLQDEPKAYERFMKLSEGYQKEFITWIYAAKREETRISRIAAMISKVLQGQTLSKK
ncbi:MAG: DUF1905 domain-containing protein [Rhizobacter sp.]|nr:DUF1905 domain-containing protein [Ferruginibacter sp.]